MDLNQDVMLTDTRADSIRLVTGRNLSSFQRDSSQDPPSDGYQGWKAARKSRFPPFLGW
jgi:hypothetical protein